MKRSVFTCIALAILAAACAMPDANSMPTAVPTPALVFDYDASVPFDVKINSETEQDGVIVTDLSYAAHDKNFASNLDGRTVAYLIRPAKGQESFAGLIFMHGNYIPIPNRKAFITEAVALAKHGVVSLLIQQQVPAMQELHFDASDVNSVVGQVIETRRAIDFLVAQPGVDPQRIGVIGHDEGALYTAILSGVDARPKTFIIDAGNPTWEEAYKKPEYRLVMAQLEPVDYVGKAGSAAILFQFGEQDVYTPKEQVNRFYAAIPGPKELLWYPTGHAMDTDQIRQDRMAWLIEKLGLPGQ